MSAGTEIALYLIRNVGALILLVVVCAACCTLARQFLQPDFATGGPIDQPTATTPAGRAAPTGRIDWAVIVIAVLLQSLILASIAWVTGDRWALPGLPTLLAWGAVGVLGLLVNLYFFILIAMIIVSWVAPGSRHPAIELIWQISEPVMAPFRSILPNMAASISPRFYCSLAST